MRWYCNRRCSNICQPSLCWRCVTLVVRRWILRVNRAALLCIFSSCQCYFGYVYSKLSLHIQIRVLITYCRLHPLLVLAGCSVHLSRQVCADFDAVVCTCLVQDSLESMIMPRYGREFTREIDWFEMMLVN